MTRIQLTTKIDGVYPSGEVYHNAFREDLLKDDEISVGNIITKIRKKLKPYKPRWLQLTCQDIHNWLSDDTIWFKREEPLRIAEKDEYQRTLRWTLIWKDE